MFDHCSNITITDGNFNVLERRPSDFRSIRLGDLNLLTQMGNEEELISSVVKRRGPRLVRRKVIVGSRKVYRARIFGSQDPMTAVVYEGSQFEKWKHEAERRQSGRVHSPLCNQAQFTSTTTELITITHFRQLHRESPLTSEFIEYQMPNATGSGSGCRLCYHDLRLQSDSSPSWLISVDLIPWEMCIELSVHDHIPLGKLATVGRDLLDFQVYFPDSERSKVEPRIRPWRDYRLSTSIYITALDTQWTRTRIVVPAASRTNMHFSSDSAIDNTPYTRKSWISQAPRLLDSGIATGVKLDDLLLIDHIYLSMRLHYPEQNTDPPSNMPYLFVSSPATRIKEDGTVWIEILPPDQRYYWSFDPSGEEQLEEDLAGQLSLPQVAFKVYACGRSWTTAQYDLLRKVHELKGVN
ncbi:hypothetical protein B0H17DRAFT_1280434 [Mycena rosella]|uniref:Uncharacterized protein n=1 Tax=Mycena rosella TaxID=1033263 RepID=A0AAD7BXZ9_MYCRO|nr:hypothetical protein B0H17DRAFT_1280434 [Mycena rosella]